MSDCRPSLARRLASVNSGSRTVTPTPAPCQRDLWPPELPPERDPTMQLFSGKVLRPAHSRPDLLPMFLSQEPRDLQRPPRSSTSSSAVKEAKRAAEPPAGLTHLYSRAPGGRGQSAAAAGPAPSWGCGSVISLPTDRQTDVPNLPSPSPGGQGSDCRRLEGAGPGPSRGRRGLEERGVQGRESGRAQQEYEGEVGREADGGAGGGGEEGEREERPGGSWRQKRRGGAGRRCRGDNSCRCAGLTDTENPGSTTPRGQGHGGSAPCRALLNFHSARRRSPPGYPARSAQQGPDVEGLAAPEGGVPG
ncbi:hypothetical protein P7K49_029377 [Saguinus oedipus]|uniref:Uncharacterized protein n=1 Tax=Saguinus oedipus TaxID=9490 RepID=A0ABQ9U718_SAGOE|nr:hypothetical protein P7K49_029377 [Saguinus oedipus]